ncbi:uncharacterized protein BJX67DRAFT_41181 [Aspergillus lucknowensis]|uniref:Uncharacterized protein n=1 Tax=Aspergillus lucknowensis TaxID=176173 RepID=A0ABR4LV97_9EURO
MNPLHWLASLLRKLQPNSPDQQQSALYGLDHAILNAPIPPPSMWMNLGYWKDTTDFPTACAALLDQVLITASLLDENGGPLLHPETKRFRLLDVGIGCGDQSLRILDYKRTKETGGKRGVGVGEGEGEDGPTEESQSLFDSYVGITSLSVQAGFAERRVQARQCAQQKDGDESENATETETTTKPRARIFCADAANPASWSPEINASLPPHDSSQKPKGEDHQKAEAEGHEGKEEETWLLALDTLYHFHPSRTPLLKHAHSTLHASLMAFDLLLPSSWSWSTRFLLRVLCLLTGTPYTNFLTQSQYTALLVEAGYEESNIEFRDISEHVFSGIAAFLGSRERVLRAYGLGGGFGKFAGARRVFAWWGSGVVRGVIVVARV